MTEAFSPQPLPYDKNKQRAILGHLLKSRQFFLQVVGKITPDWFADPYCSKVLEQMEKFYDKYKRPGTTEEIKNALEVLSWEMRDRNKFHEAINLAVAYSADYGLDVLAQELTRWYHAETYRAAMRKSAQLYNLHRDTEAYDVLEQASNKIQWTSFEPDPEERFDQLAIDLESNAAAYEHSLTFGLKTMDQKLNPKAKDGALLRGDTSIALAAVNVGKSSSLITTLGANLRRCHSALWITHEGRPADLKEKLLRNLLGLTSQQLLGGYDALGNRIPAITATEEGRQRLAMAGALCSKFLTYLPMNRAGLTVEEVAATIRARQERRLVEKGKGYDLLVVDYPAILTTRQATGGQFAKRTIDEIVYKYFVQLGLEYLKQDDPTSGFHVLLAIQSNREGSRVNKGQKEERLLTMEDVHESFGPMQSATNVWSINRDPEAMAARRLTYYIDKSRSSETGWAVVCRTDYDRSTTHSDELGATCYRGAGTHSDKIDDLLSKYLNKGAIPDAALAGA